MRFAQPNYFFWFWIVAALVIFLIWAWRKRNRDLQRFAQSASLSEILSAVDVKKKFIKQGLEVFALIFIVFALVRPQWGFQWREIKRQGLDILIALDTSKSMLATDVKPNRLERSKLAVKDLVRKLRGDRIGLIAFSGTAFLQCPLTVDYNGFLLSLDDVKIDTIPRGGTNLSAAIQTAVESYKGGQKKHKVLVIITDGENHEGDPLAQAKRAAKEGLKIFCIGIGTSEGELIQYVDADGKKVFLKDKEGNVVKSRLNEEILQQVALASGAAYVRSSGAEFGLDLIYKEKLSSLERREFKSQMVQHFHERFQMPLAIALLLLAVELCVSERKRA